jgi:hypothetical protein
VVYVTCCYCRHVITDSDDSQRVSRRVYAHDICAWRVNDAFFALLDATSGEHAKAPQESTEGLS